MSFNKAILFHFSDVRKYDSQPRYVLRTSAPSEDEYKLAQSQSDQVGSEPSLGAFGIAKVATFPQADNDNSDQIMRMV